MGTVDFDMQSMGQEELSAFVTRFTLSGSFPLWTVSCHMLLLRISRGTAVKSGELSFPGLQATLTSCNIASLLKAGS